MQVIKKVILVVNLTLCSAFDCSGSFTLIVLLCGTIVAKKVFLCYVEFACLSLLESRCYRLLRGLTFLFFLIRHDLFG